MRTNIHLFLAIVIVFFAIDRVVADEVQQTNDRTLRGTITEITPDEVKITNSAGAEQVVAAEDVKRIILDSEPAELKSARNNALNTQYNRVLSELDKMGDPPNDKFILGEVAFYRALAAGKLALSGEAGTLSDAGTIANKFVNSPTGQNSYHFYEGVELLGDLLMAVGKPDVAEKNFAKMLASQSKTVLLSGHTKVAESQLAQGKFDEALSSFDQAIAVDSTSPDAPRLKLFAGIGRANCLAELKRADEGIAFLQDLIKNQDSSQNELFARAYNALGNCYLKSGKDKEAVHAYLFTDVLFFQNAYDHGEALYNLSLLWEKLNKTERARDARNTLNTPRYQNTVWAKKVANN